MERVIKCQTCGKIIGNYNTKTNEVIEMFDNYNTCDICGKEICTECSINDFENEHCTFNGCWGCYQELKKEREE